jgi:uncharacterized protein DUF5666
VTDDSAAQIPTGRPRRRRHLARAGILVVAGLAVVISATVAIGAAPGAGVNAPSAAPSGKADRGNGNKKDKSDNGQGLKLGKLGLPGLGFGKDNGEDSSGRQITITSIIGSTVSLKTDDGWTRTVTLAADTKVFVGSQAGTAADLKVGDNVRLRQQRNADGSFTVLALVVQTPTAAGSVTAVGSTTISIKGGDGSTATITINGSTKFQIGKSSASKSDVHVGSRIAAEGTGTSDKLTATIVRIAPTLASGVVTAKTANSITIKQQDGSSLVVHLSAATTYRVRGAATKPGGLADIKVGDRLVAVGTTRADKSLEATAVGAGTGKAPKPETDDSNG